LELNAGTGQIAALFSAASAGTVVFALLASRLKERISFSSAVLGSVIAIGALIVVLARTHAFVPALLLVAVIAGLIGFFNVNTVTLRQTITPPELLGRVSSVARVLSWSAVPVGVLIGSWAIQVTGDVELVFTVIGVAVVTTGVAFSFTALGRADAHLVRDAPGGR